MELLNHLSFSITGFAWMPAFADMTDYDTAAEGEGQGGGLKTPAPE